MGEGILLEKKLQSGSFGFFTRTRPKQAIFRVGQKFSFSESMSGRPTKASNATKRPHFVRFLGMLEKGKWLWYFAASNLGNSPKGLELSPRCFGGRFPARIVNQDRKNDLYRRDVGPSRVCPPGYWARFGRRVARFPFAGILGPWGIWKKTNGRVPLFFSMRPKILDRPDTLRLHFFSSGGF